MKNILVLGGTGFVGRQLCEQLDRTGWRATVPTREPARGALLQHLSGVTVMEADVHDAGTLARLVPGHDAVVNLVAILHGNAAAFERAHVELPRKLALACLQGGVTRLVHVSALGADVAGPSRYQRSKAQGEAALIEAGLDLTLLRPSVIFGAEDRFLNLFARLQRLFPIMPLAGAHARFQPVWVNDVARAIILSLERHTRADSEHTEIIECVGPDVLTLADLVRLAGRHGSRQRPGLPLYMPLGRLQALMMELAPGETLMSRDNLDSMRVDNVASGRHPDLRSLGIAPASVLTVAPAYLGRRQER
ncbi:MAG TPA: complex I NDUFA9 subunit family protein [Hydrogenophaga sp.]|uniref:complex I NDUFA9 subunit family protein n=1 Tax=Hydrogenophaga sp. TaxID=1904254 RepID=UPI002C7CB52F|nr:complex I NDUFA9 subunit family protein [Hydrogenophaga sp.]HMN94134.1 complex I NDUFA9 subunit family protein [Hydrogenophaga sp.]